jgi:hypothetical protein
MYSKQKPHDQVQQTEGIDSFDSNYTNLKNIHLFNVLSIISLEDVLLNPINKYWHPKQQLQEFVESLLAKYLQLALDVLVKYLF